MQYSSNLELLDKGHRICLNNSQKAYIWVPLNVYPNTTYCLTVTGKVHQIKGRVYLWIGDAMGNDLYNKKKYISSQEDTHIAYFHNKKNKTLMAGLCFYGCKDGSSCSINTLNINIKKTGKVVYNWGEVVVKSNIKALTNSFEERSGVLPSSFEERSGALPPSFEERSGVRFGSEIYSLTGNIMEEKTVGYDYSFTFCKGRSKEPMGIETMIKTTPRCKYKITIRGKTRFSKGGALYLWAGNLHDKMVHFKPVQFKDFDTEGIGWAEIIIGTHRYQKMKIALYYRGRIIHGDGFNVANIEIKKIKSNGTDNDNIVLILGDFAQMRHAVALNRLKIWEYIRNRDSRVVMFGTDHPKYRDGISINNIVTILGIFPQIVIHLQYNLGTKLICRGLDTYRCRKIVTIEDMHQPEVFAKAAHNGKFNDVLYNCDCMELDVIRKKLPTQRFLHMPHYVDTRVFTDYGLAREWDIIFYGTQGADYYPFRNRLYNLLLDCKRFNIKVIPFTGYSPEKAKMMPRGSELAKLINQSWIGIATTSRVDYFVKKYLEIPACNTMVAGNIPTRKADILRGNIVQLDPLMDDQTIVETLVRILEDKKQLLKKIAKLRKLIAQHYSFEAGYKHFITYCH